MQTSMKLFIVSCLNVALCYASDWKNDLYISGTISDRSNTPCVGEQCTQPLSGPHLTIWHGDESCSKLYLYCELDRITLALESSPNASDASLLFLGVPPVKDPRSRGECYSEQQYKRAGDERMRAFALSPAGRIIFSSRHDKCGTNSTNSEFGEEFYNTVEVLEFLQVPGYTDPSVLLVSRTNIHVTCCLRTDTPFSECSPDPGLPPIALPLVNCTEKDFDLDCRVDSTTEQFICTVKLSSSTLGTEQIGYYVDSCDASSADGSQTQKLIWEGKYYDEELEVTRRSSNSGGSPDDIQFEIRTPYFQFNSDRTEKDPQPVTISCAVKFALKDEVAPLQADLGSWVAPRLSFGQDGAVNGNALVQAGKVSVKK